MRNRIFLILVFSIFISIMLTSCFDLFDDGVDTIVSDYKISWIDVRENRSLTKGERLIDAYVFAVGHDSKYIYAKQHPLSENPKEKINQKITNYYIIEQSKNSFQDKPIYGPLDKINFRKKCKELGIEEVEFDLTYPINFTFH